MLESGHTVGTERRKSAAALRVLRNQQRWRRLGLNVTLVTRYQPGPNKNRCVADLVVRTARFMFRRRFLPVGRFTVASPHDSSGREGL